MSQGMPFDRAPRHGPQAAAREAVHAGHQGGRAPRPMRLWQAGPAIPCRIKVEAAAPTEALASPGRARRAAHAQACRPTIRMPQHPCAPRLTVGGAQVGPNGGAGGPGYPDVGVRPPRAAGKPLIGSRAAPRHGKDRLAKVGHAHSKAQGGMPRDRRVVKRRQVRRRDQRVRAHPGRRDKARRKVAPQRGAGQERVLCRRDAAVGAQEVVGGHRRARPCRHSPRKDHRRRVHVRKGHLLRVRRGRPRRELRNGGEDEEDRRLWRGGKVTAPMHARPHPPRGSARPAQQLAFPPRR